AIAVLLSCPEAERVARACWAFTRLPVGLFCLNLKRSAYVTTTGDTPRKAWRAGLVSVFLLNRYFSPWTFKNSRSRGTIIAFTRPVSFSADTGRDLTLGRPARSRPADFTLYLGPSQTTT